MVRAMVTSRLEFLDIFPIPGLVKVIPLLYATSLFHSLITHWVSTYRHPNCFVDWSLLR